MFFRCGEGGCDTIKPLWLIQACIQYSEISEGERKLEIFIEMKFSRGQKNVKKIRARKSWEFSLYDHKKFTFQRRKN